MGVEQKVWDRYCDSEIAVRYWELASQRCGKLHVRLHCMIGVISAALLPLIFLQASPWLLAAGGFLISALGLVIAHKKTAERKAVAETAHALWGLTNDDYRKLQERCRDREEVTDRDLSAIVAQDEALSTVTRLTFGSADKELVKMAEAQRNEFLGVRPAGS